ncbi:competence protein ComK [Amphibacillus sediminis]|uniref:competence protein ComK n=1 Tax=Amphibacillus sediminis TaxID=360185 RepID=UPI00082DFBEF|nr:competence protein ComK [Amphibacillus sediminis]
MSQELKTSHELSHTTMAFIATEYDGLWCSLVYEEEVKDPILVKSSPLKLIESACRHYGEELIARFDGAKLLCDFNNKTPIAISSSNGIFFFPTQSPTSISCSWISHTHIRRIKKADYGSSMIVFRDGRELLLPISEGIMQNQVNRTAQYRFILSEQLKPNQQQGALNAMMKVIGHMI